MTCIGNTCGVLYAQATHPKKGQAPEEVKPAEKAKSTTPTLEIEGEPKVEDTGAKGNDGSPKLKITVTFKQPIPAGFTKAKLEVCTFSPDIRCWAQGSPFDVNPGDKSVTVEGWFHHSLDYNKKDPKKGEYALLKINNPTTKQAIEIRFDVDIPGDF